MKIRAVDLIFATVAGAAVLASPMASAAAMLNGLLQGGENQLQDTDAERFVRCSVAVDPNDFSCSTGTYAPVTSGNIMEGDIVETILRFTDVNANVISDSVGFGAPYQLIAYAELLVRNIDDTGLPPGFGTLTFAPTGNLGANVFADIRERTANVPGFDVTVAPDTGIAQTQAQTLIAQIGIGDADDFWTATTLLDLTTAAAALPGSGQQANGVFGLSFVSNVGGIPFEANGIVSGTTGTNHDIVGSASAYVLDTSANTGWLVSSNTEARFNVNVPVPSTILLLGLGLVAAGGLSRRRHT